MLVTFYGGLLLEIVCITHLRSILHAEVVLIVILLH